MSKELEIIYSSIHASNEDKIKRDWEKAWGCEVEMIRDKDGHLTIRRKVQCSSTAWMTSADYQLVISKTPIPCVDLVVFNSTLSKVLLFIRKIGYMRGKWCNIGGRQWIGETVQDTFKRQVDDIGIEAEICPPFDYGFPVWVNDNPKQDETKHPVTSVYPIKIIGGRIKKEGQEFMGYKWFNINRLPSEIAFDHQKEIQVCIERLK